MIYDHHMKASDIHQYLRHDKIFVRAKKAADLWNANTHEES